MNFGKNLLNVLIKPAQFEVRFSFLFSTGLNARARVCCLLRDKVFLLSSFQDEVIFDGCGEFLFQL